MNGFRENSYQTNESVSSSEAVRDLEEKFRLFLQQEVAQLTQAEVNTRLQSLFEEQERNKMPNVDIWRILPDHVSQEEMANGVSVWAKIYSALFELSSTETYKNSPQMQMNVREMENIIDQNPQMMGPVAMWRIAKEVMWRKDIPSHAKGNLMGSMTYALAFFDTESYESELLKNLDFKNAGKYAEVAHMLEALKQFWTQGHESYAEERNVPDFYIEALRQIKESPEANYLLSVRSREMLSMLEQSEDFPNEARDIKPFELSKEIYASTQVGEGLTVSDDIHNPEISEAISEFESIDKELSPPQWMIDEAVERGESWVQWQPPRHLVKRHSDAFDRMHRHLSIPIENFLQQHLPEMNEEKSRELIFDYEYLVSRPMRELVEREFGFELKQLKIEEQFYFLNYLKQTTVAEAGTMQAFTQNYGIDGMRAFLTNAYDGNASENIMVFGTMIEPDDAKKAFGAYAEALDSTKELVGRFTGESKELLQEIEDGMLRRAGHLFFAGKQMALWEYPGQESTENLIDAFNGVAKIQDVLAKLGNDAKLQYTAEANSEKNATKEGHKTYTFKITDGNTGEKLKLNVTIRPEATAKAEARINFELHLDDLDDQHPLKKAFSQTVFHRKEGKLTKKSVIRLGFDLDTKTNPPVFSFDMGRNSFDGDTIERTGDVLGNILDKVAPEGHHLTTFSERFSDPKTFALIAQSFSDYFEQLTTTAKRQ